MDAACADTDKMRRGLYLRENTALSRLYGEQKRSQ